METVARMRNGMNGGEITPPDLPNIVREIRKRADITQKELANLAGLSTLFILRAEQFLHVELSKPLSVALASIDPDNRSAEDISLVYFKGRLLQLKFNSDMMTSSPYYRIRVSKAMNYAVDHSLNSDQAKASKDSHSHPFALFRTHLFTAFDLPTSQIKFCVFTGVHPTVIAALESYSTGLLDSVATALSIVLDLSQAEIDTLKYMCEQAL